MLASSLANVIWNAGVGRVGGTGTAVYANVTPLFAVASAWFLLGERITWMQAAGALVIFVGLRLTQWITIGAYGTRSSSGAVTGAVSGTIEFEPAP